MLKFSGLALRRGTTLLFESVSFTVHSGQKVGVTGANGTGKSSLFSLIQGNLSSDQGEFSKPADWVIAIVEQETRLNQQAAVEYVIDGDNELRQTEARLAEAEREHHGDQIGTCHERLVQIDGYNAYARAAILLSGLGFDDAEIENPLKQFSGGWLMRLNLARALMCRSDLLLLDEPTNHLDLDAVIWLEQWLRRYAGTLLLISHDREFLDAVVDHIAHFEQQGIELYRGNYSTFEKRRAERLAQQQANYKRQQKSIAHIQSFVDRFKAKASKARQAQSRIKALERMQLIAPAHIDSPFHFEFTVPRALPTSFFRFDRVAIGYGDTTVLSDISFSMIPGERIGLLGLNGAGKSTFIKLLAGELQPRGGQADISRDLKIGYFAQHQVEQLDLDASALLILQRLDESLSEREIRTYLGGFNFGGDRVMQRVGTFSGGEKSRLVLALLIWQRPNLILLDEPTNHLDLEMRLALNNALQTFEGSMILVSHDRYLLRSVCDDLWLVDAGKLQRFDGDIDAYPAWLAKRKGGQADRSKPNGNKSNSRQTRKVDEMAVRRLLKPQLKLLKQLENRIEKLSKRKGELESQLAEASIYQQAQKELLNDTLFEQAEVARDLNKQEDEWISLSEEIEAVRESTFIDAV
ncbi:MAG: ATP-binding cassette domain-containing protein [Gammaproteobacteria bacterium]|nr:MAG: ATP-binding cassette domain-containing protein [Gammaproteobacteria bacterium]